MAGFRRFDPYVSLERRRQLAAASSGIRTPDSNFRCLGALGGGVTSETAKQDADGQVSGIDFQTSQIDPPPKAPKHLKLGIGDRIPSAIEGALATLERRCPEHIDPVHWRQAVADGRRFLEIWGKQAEAFGWTADELFGLHQPPENPHPSYSRLSRYDETGLIWLLRGNSVVALTADTAAIQYASGSVTNYRKLNKPALGPVGDSLDDFV
jgi:hypothetical protein